MPSRTGCDSGAPLCSHYILGSRGQSCDRSWQHRDAEPLCSVSDYSSHSRAGRHVGSSMGPVCAWRGVTVPQSRCAVPTQPGDAHSGAVHCRLHDALVGDSSSRTLFVMTCNSRGLCTLDQRPDYLWMVLLRWGGLAVCGPRCSSVSMGSFVYIVREDSYGGGSKISSVEHSAQYMGKKNPNPFAAQSHFLN